MGGLPQLVTGVWVGNADNSPINLGSGPGAGEIYRRYMLALIKQRGADLPVENWTAPAGMVQVETCGNLTTYGGWGWSRPADGVEPCPFAAVNTWIIPGFNDPVSAVGADLPRYGTFAVDSRNRIVDPAVCAAARNVTGLFAIAERPEWQDDLEAWIAAGTPRGKSTRAYPWAAMAMILPGDGQCVDGDAATPTPDPTLPPASAPPSAP
jgi:membrane peptidoglycan carboxypeptidase